MPQQRSSAFLGYGCRSLFLGSAVVRCFPEAFESAQLFVFAWCDLKAFRA